MGVREQKKAQEVLERYLGASDQLIALKNAFSFSSRARGQFLKAMKEAFALHYLGSERYRRWCDAHQVLPHQIRDAKDLEKIPFLFVHNLKYHEYVSVPEEQVSLVLHSSGTSGQKSCIYLDRRSLKRITKIVDHIYDSFSMTGDYKVNYLCFSYDPEVANDVGTAFSDKLLTGLTRTNQVYYTMQWDEATQGWKQDFDQIAEILEAYHSSGKPFRILGFPAHVWETLQYCVERRGANYRFHPRSYVITGGGWKGKQDEQIEPAIFRAKLAQWLGIEVSHVRDLYGMVEHGVPYCECEHHFKHVPIYAHALCRDPRSLEPLKMGEEGLLHFYTPYHHSFPAISLLTTDYGKITVGCPCGRKAPVVHLLGRAGIKKARGCALEALKV